MDGATIVKKNLQEAIQLKQQLLADETTLAHIGIISELVIKCYISGGKILFCGNGGSAADAQHLAAELSGKYYYDRRPLFAEALHVNTSHLTAVANDYSFEDVYSRLTEAMGRKGDILIGLSTSGNSRNVIKAMEMAMSKGMSTVGLTGQGGGGMKPVCDYLIEIPSADTPRIQECHMLVGHTICEIVEHKLFPRR
ncbi:MAG TPA: SIS domain-containing protein [Bacteroidetes bacterium]|nr:SIS domain-containing protein [Bacteroidota bacterium]